jgi:hypothetical protein
MRPPDVEELRPVARAAGWINVLLALPPNKEVARRRDARVFETLRVAIEFAHVVDYDESEGGTGNSANGLIAQLTYEL